MTIAVDRFAVALGVIVLRDDHHRDGSARRVRRRRVVRRADAREPRGARARVELRLQIVGGVALGIVGTALSLRSPEARSYRTSEVIVTRDGTLARVVSRSGCSTRERRWIGWAISPGGPFRGSRGRSPATRRSRLV